MNYGDLKNVEEKVSTAGKYMVHGVNENISLSVGNYISDEKGEKFDVTIINETGAEYNWRIYPFNFNEKFEGSEEVQQKEYLTNLRHIFSKALGEDNYKKVAEAPISSFKDFSINFTKAIKGMPKIKFHMIMIDNGKGFPKVPSWKGGFAFTDLEDAKTAWSKMNQTKYGRPKKDNSKVEKPATTDAPVDNDLPDFLK